MLSYKILAGAAVSAALLAGVLLAERLEDTISLPYDHKAIQYYERTPTDAAQRLLERLDKHQVKLDFAPGASGYLSALLKQFDINPDSQVLVFSQTSLQSPRISPARPRAIYFNDTVSVGWVQNGDVMEISALDPILGVSFYTMETRKSDNQFLARREVCMQCHLGGQTLGVPGLMVSSLYQNGPNVAGLHASNYLTDHRTKFEERWGGWYVTGSMGGQKHLGNAMPDPQRPDRVDAQGGKEWETLEGHVDTRPYLAPGSDVVALMTLEHQARMTNLITRIAWDTRIAMADGKLEASRDKINAAIEEMLPYMLFAEEAPVTAPIRGTSTFTTTFPARGPRDKQGRSLRDFDLKTRLFRYPLSYMIYTPAFDAMPDYARERIYRRLYDVLTGADADAKFARLTPEDRRAVLEIVRDTKPKLPAYWKTPPAP